MAGTTAWIISNLLSSIQKLSQFMHPFPSIPASSSSSSSSIEGDGTASDVHSIQEKLMEDLSRLSRMLRRIHTVLHDAEEREIYDKSIQLWLSELREVAYDAEDVLDKYDYQVIKTQVEGMTVAAEAEHSLKRKHADDDDDDDDDDLYDFQLQLDPDEYSDRTFASTSLEFTFVSVNVCPKMKDWCQWHGFPYDSLLGRDTT